MTESNRTSANQDLTRQRDATTNAGLPCRSPMLWRSLPSLACPISPKSAPNQPHHLSIPGKGIQGLGVRASGAAHFFAPSPLDHTGAASMGLPFTLPGPPRLCGPR
ncbi:hypothetical protein, partial [Dictyobacter arantiisoli]|uniref:hypothetical protein n=1 Tax=Dictyobacter arantiisoli TaxID=2014874 RepID=UPI001C0EFD73